MTKIPPASSFHDKYRNVIVKYKSFAARRSRISWCEAYFVSFAGITGVFPQQLCSTANRDAEWRFDGLRRNLKHSEREIFGIPIGIRHRSTSP